MFTEILVPLDTHELSRCAIPYARQLARSLSARLTFLVISQSPSRSLWICDANGYVSSEVYEADLQVIEKSHSSKYALGKHLEDLVTDLHSSGIAARWTIMEGNPAPTICAQADVIGADLIVMTPSSPYRYPTLAFWDRSR